MMGELLKVLMEKWAALYVRLSRDDDNEGDSNSIAHQIEIDVYKRQKNSFPSPHRQQIFRLLGNKKRGFASYSKLEKKQTLFV